MDQPIIVKDAWYSAYKNFLHVSYLAGFFFLAFGGMYVMDAEGVAGSGAIAGLLIFFFTAIIWYYLAQLFKRRDKKAITFGYAIQAIALVVSLVSANVIALFITAFFLYLVYKASRVPA